MHFGETRQSTQRLAKLSDKLVSRLNRLYRISFNLLSAVAHSSFQQRWTSTSRALVCTPPPEKRNWRFCGCVRPHLRNIDVQVSSVRACAPLRRDALLDRAGLKLGHGVDEERSGCGNTGKSVYERMETREIERGGNRVRE